MKSDMNDLKRLVLQLMDGDRKNEDIIEENRDLFSEVRNNRENENFESFVQNPLLISHASNPEISSSVNYDMDKIEDIMHVTEPDESLSIEKKEKELIIKALKKNNNKRKYAAQDLGISERTLYRKIKQYELENE